MNLAPARVSFVLGGGGGPGIAYLCGALRALEEHARLRLADGDLIVGTSAGAVVAARLLAGQEIDDVLAPSLADGVGKSVLQPRWTSRSELARCALGAGWALWRTSVRLPVPAPSDYLQRMFPPALFTVAGWESSGIPEPWPDQPLWLVTADFDTHRRIVLRRPERADQTATLRQAVIASCAVPGVFHPERVGRRQLVDGGMVSVTNLDLAARAHSRIVIAVAPMGYDPLEPISSRRAAARARFNWQLAREERAVRRAGGQVLLLRPTGADLAAQRGVGLFAQDRAAEIALRARATTLRQLRRPPARGMLRAAHELLAGGARSA